MKQVLIKLSETHYIIVDNSEIKEGDFFYFKQSGEDIAYQTNKDTNFVNLNNPDKYFRKLTHSTQPLEVVDYICDSGEPKEEILDFYNIKPLSLSDCQEIDFGYSVEKILDDKLKVEISEGNIKPKETVIYAIGLEDGLKLHKELVKDKLFTVEDMRKAISMARDYPADVVGYMKDEIIQSLLPKTEWKVEFIDGKLKLKS